MAKKTISQVQVGNPIYGGNFLAKLNGKAVFVPFSLPGELVKIAPLVEQKKYTVAELIEVSTPSAERIDPFCPAFQKCGGCHYQHIGYQHQLELKTAIFAEQLTKIGKLKEPNVLPILASEIATGYRNNARYSLDWKGDLAFVNHDPQKGLVAIERCPIASDGVNEVSSTLKFDPSLGIKKVSIREGVDGVLVVLDSEQPEVPEIVIEGNYSVVHVSGEDSVVIAGDDHIHIDVLGYSFKVSAGSFFQVNTQMAEVMVKTVLEGVGFEPTDVVFDLYCGVGLFSAFIAPKVAELVGIEVSGSSTADFAENLDQFDNVSLYEADVAEALPHIDQKADVIVIDPPRAGIDKKVLDRIVEIAPRTIAYVSCDPSTLARDLSRFIAAGYELRFAQPLDMFPNTYHIEAVCVLIRLDI